MDIVATLTSGVDFLVVSGRVVGVDGVSSVIVDDSVVVFGAGVFVDEVVFAFDVSVSFAVCVEDSELERLSDVSVVNGGKVLVVVVSVSIEVLRVGETVVFVCVGDVTLVNVAVSAPSVVVGASVVVLGGRVISDSVDSAFVVSVVNVGSRVDVDADLVIDVVEDRVVGASVVVLRAILIADVVGTAVVGSVVVVISVPVVIIADGTGTVIYVL